MDPQHTDCLHARSPVALSDAVKEQIAAGTLPGPVAVKGSSLQHFSTLREPVIVIRKGIRYK